MSLEVCRACRGSGEQQGGPGDGAQCLQCGGAGRVRVVASNESAFNESTFYTRNPTAQKFKGRLIEMRSQEDLLRNAFFQMKRWREWRGRDLWTLVGAITGHGSGYSQQICEELGWPYDMKITPTAKLPPRTTHNPQ